MKIVGCLVDDLRGEGVCKKTDDMDGAGASADKQREVIRFEKRGPTEVSASGWS